MIEETKVAIDPIEEALADSQARASRFEKEAIGLEQEAAVISSRAAENRLLMAAEEAKAQQLARAIRPAEAQA